MFSANGLPENCVYRPKNGPVPCRPVNAYEDWMLRVVSVRLSIKTACNEPREIRMKRFLVLLVSFGLALLAALPADASITNGSFELGDYYPPGGSFRTLYASDDSHDDILGWDVVENSIDWIDGYWQASDGDYSIDMSGVAAGTIVSQTFSTIAGIWYQVAFDLSGNPDSVRGINPDYSWNSKTP